MKTFCKAFCGAILSLGWGLEENFGPGGDECLMQAHVEAILVPPMGTPSGLACAPATEAAEIKVLGLCGVAAICGSGVTADPGRQTDRLHSPCCGALAEETLGCGSISCE